MPPLASLAPTPNPSRRREGNRLAQPADLVETILVTTLPPLALSLGDPAGVGPELACAAWLERREAGLSAFFVVGSISVLAGAAQARGLTVPLLAIDAPDAAAACFGDVLPVLDIAGLEYAPGVPSKAGAELAFQSLEIATGLVRGGAAAALVTAPVAKAQLAAVGFTHPGQTEYVAER